MANIFDGSRYILDTAGVITALPRRVKSISWNGTGLTAGTSKVTLTDAVTGDLIREFFATGTTVDRVELIEDEWPHGFTLTTISGGKLIVELL